MNKKKKADEQISEALDLEITKEQVDILHDGQNAGGYPIMIPTTEEDKLKRDYNLVRKNLKEIIDTGNNAIDGILTVATETESPRAYEVVAQMIKNVADINKDLLETHNKIKQIQKEDSGQKANNITNNSLFVGSTQELQKLLKQQKEQLIENEIEEQEALDIIDVEFEEKDA
jgi:hypothetical protein